MGINGCGEPRFFRHDGDGMLCSVTEMFLCSMLRIFLERWVSGAGTRFFSVLTWCAPECVVRDCVRYCLEHFCCVFPLNSPYRTYALVLFFQQFLNGNLWFVLVVKVPLLCCCLLYVANSRTHGFCSMFPLQRCMRFAPFLLCARSRLWLCVLRAHCAVL